MGRDLLCKLRAHITFDSDGTADLKLRGPEAKTLILMVAQKWIGSSMSLKLEDSSFQVYGLKITPRSGPKCASSSGGIKAGSHPPQPETILYSLQGPGQNSKTL
jgi:hypothetical protein